MVEGSIRQELKEEGSASDSRGHVAEGRKELSWDDSFCLLIVSTSLIRTGGVQLEHRLKKWMFRETNVTQNRPAFYA